MTIYNDLKANYHGARLSRDTVAKNLLSTIIGDIESKAVVVEGKKEVSEEIVTSVLKSFLKKNQEMQSLIKNNDQAMLDAVREEAIIKSHLPSQLEPSQIHMILLRSGVDKNMGAMMKYLKEHYSGQYDGKVASEEIKRILSDPAPVMLG